jgi:hypothetical protein
VRFDSSASSAQRAFVTIRNGLVYRVLTPRNLRMAVVLLVVGVIAYRATRPTPEQLAARAKEAAAAAVAARDSSVISSMKRDFRMAMTAEEMYFAGMHTYGTFDQLQKEGFTLSAGNTMVIRATGKGYFLTVMNSVLPAGPVECSVQVAGGAAPSVDGVIVCRGDPKELRPKP